MQDSVGIKNAIGKELIAENGVSFSKSITQYKALLNHPPGTSEQIMLVVPTSFKGITINTKMRPDHELFSSPETSILK